MGNKTGIQWTEATWNPIRGCSRVSEGCRNCYAETVANRFKGPGQPYEGLIAKGGQWNGRITVVDHVMDQPLRWTKPRMIFVNSMSDLFHESVPEHVIDRVFAVMALASRHTFQILTKRPDRMNGYMNDPARVSRWRHEAANVSRKSADEAADYVEWQVNEGGFKNLWLGVSIEDQKTADERIPLLLQTPAAVRWVSAEPLLGGIWLKPYLNKACALHKGELDEDGECDVCAGKGIWEDLGPTQKTAITESLDWVVVGGESGPGARPMHPEWARSLRDQCVAAGVPYFFKQWGEWAPEMEKVGKKRAGRLLDGRTWDEFPKTDEQGE